MTTKASTNLFSFAVPPPREHVRVTLKKELVHELESFHAFVREHEGDHIELGHVLEHVLENYFSSSRKGMRLFREWRGNLVEEPVSKPADSGEGFGVEEPVSEPESVIETHASGVRTISR